MYVYIYITPFGCSLIKSRGLSPQAFFLFQGFFDGLGPQILISGPRISTGSAVRWGAKGFSPANSIFCLCQLEYVQDNVMYMYTFSILY